MGIDIRLPIGILFSLLGVILAAYGILGDPSQYRQSLDVNINLAWGTVLLVFGVVMWLLGRRGMRAAPQSSGSKSSDPPVHR
jgi:multisubunit Na+/H+ antiporter MnhG subunit